MLQSIPSFLKAKENENALPNTVKSKAILLTGRGGL
jgi:hypothetical protein